MFMKLPKRTISSLFIIVLLYFCVFMLPLFSILYSLFSQEVYASSFTYDITTTYTISDDYVTVQEAKSITNNTTNRYIPASEVTTFFIPQYETADNQLFEMTLDSIKTYPSYHTVEQVNGGYEVSIPFGTDLNEGETINFTLEYKDYQLMDIVGNVKNIHLPKIIFPDESTYEVKQTTLVRVPVHLSENIYYNLTPKNKTEDSKYVTFEYNKTQVSENNIYLQLGTQQFYSFLLTLDIPQTYKPQNNIKLQYNNIKILLPREYEETNQKVYISNMSIEPQKIYNDEEGNIFADFTLPATEAHHIEISGYISITLDQNKTVPTFISKDDLDPHPQLIAAEEYWEKNSEVIINAQQLIPESENLIEQIQNIYNYVVETLEYSHEKIYDNTRYGAEKALSGSSSVCMEYADSMIALLRADSIPSRAAFGRGFNSNLSESEQQDHQWVQILLPEYGWITADPTWGENGRTYIGPDLDHVLWYTSEKSPVSVSPLSYIIADNIILDAPDIEFTPISADAVTDLDPNQNIYKLIADEQENDNKTVKVYLDNWYNDMRITPLSRIIDQFFPLWLGIGIFIVVVITITFIFSVVRSFKKISHKKQNINENTN